MGVGWGVGALLSEWLGLVNCCLGSRSGYPGRRKLGWEMWIRRGGG